MKIKENFHDRRKKIGRRRKDRLIKVGQLITSELDFDTLFNVVVEQTNKIMDTERCSIFLIDENHECLEAFVSLDLEKIFFLLPKNQGIAGWVFCNKETLFANNAYEDPRFCSDADTLTGIQTKNLICTPLLGRNKKCLGTMQAMNKLSGDFTDEDQEIIIFISNYIAIAIENSMLYEDVRASDKAKDRAISHLSHELNTPLSLIDASFELISRFTEAYDDNKISKPIIRGKKNVRRLIKLQNKVRDIIDQRTDDSEQKYFTIIEDIKCFLEEYAENNPANFQDVIAYITERIHTILQVKEINNERILLDEFLKEICSTVLSDSAKRDINLKLDVEENISILMDRTILESVCMGVLKNAIENTPDKGLIIVSVRTDDRHIFFEFKDHGVGITENNQKNIFKGLFHTQKTEAYASKGGYEFNAGGTGTDLLRIRVLAERLGFSISCKSTRCHFIATDDKVCPGNILSCPNVKDINECNSSGGSMFSLKFFK
jgi:signal transduction histidine kinase